jgi:hypothetical protein
MHATAIYSTWENVIQRCTNPNCPDWKDYGGRGITVCERWRSFEDFYADVGDRPPGTTLDRIDNERGYEPGNVRWATRSQQNRNRRTKHQGAHWNAKSGVWHAKIRVNGRTKYLGSFSEKEQAQAAYTAAKARL